MEYNDEHDRSEEAGWSKYRDESVPSEEEQARWSLYSIWMMVAFLLVAVFAY